MMAVAGASGFVGRAVCDALQLRGIRVVRIGRRSDADVRWPPSGAPFDAAARRRLEDCRAVINLAGESIGARWTQSRRRAMRDSRVGLTTLLARTLADAARRPTVLISASATGYYGNRGDEVVDERSPPAADFLARLVVDWEAAARLAAEAGVRVVCLRQGVVFGRGGIVGRIRLLFQLGLGGRLGPGTQWMSWIALDDLVAFILRAVDDTAITGPVNLTSPTPITNAEFTRILGRVLHRPTPLPAPAFALRLAFGEMADALLLTSQRVRPARLAELGFAYAHPEAESALRASVAA